MKFSLAILILLAVLMTASFAGAQGNLVKNPGFEDGDCQSSLPVGGWWVYEAQGKPGVSVDTFVVREGKSSVKLSADSEARFTVVSGPFPVTPFDDMNFEAFVRAENLKGGKDPVGIALSFRDVGGKVFARNFIYPTKPLSGDWTQLAGSAVVPAGAVTGEMFLQFSRATGAVWFDSVSAVVANPVSLSLTGPPKPYVGEQTITALVVNHGDLTAAGTLRLTLGKQVTDVPVSIAARSEARVPLTINMKAPGAQDYSIELVRASGESERKITGKFTASAPLIVYPACPCYHAAGEGDGATRLAVQVNVHPDRLPGARIVASITDLAGDGVAIAEADASKGGLVEQSVRVPVTMPADFVADIELLDSVGQRIASGKADIHIVPRETCRVVMGADGYPRVNGKPEFPLGLYSSGRFPELAQAGFSFSHNYSITTGEPGDPINPNDIRLKELLDANAEAGIRMMVELPRKAIEKGEWAQVRRRIETFKNHPGLGFWGSEERVARGEGPLKNVAGVYRIVKELDPNHPFVLGDTRDVVTKLSEDRSNFFPVSLMDVGIWWYYPIPMEPNPEAPPPAKVSDLTFMPPNWLVNYTGDKPLWIAVQCYKHPRIDGRYPTRAEYRQMAYMPLVYGAKGLAFYTGSGQLDYYKKPSGILNNPEQGDWEYVKQLIREMRDLNPVLTAPVVTGRITKSPDDEPVDFIVKEADGKLTLIAVNRAKRTIKMRFCGVGIAGTRVTVHGENRTVPVTRSSFTDTFAPYAVHIYALGG